MPVKTPAERQEEGRAAREHAPLSAHAEWSSAHDRPDPVTLLAAQNEQRVP
ncbi:MAG: hypothetical protein ABFR89_10760 [Actinomycetota bacterium]